MPPILFISNTQSKGGTITRVICSCSLLLLLAATVDPALLQAAPNLTIQQNSLPAAPDTAQATTPLTETVATPQRKKRTNWYFYAACAGGALLIILFYLRGYLRKKDLEQLWSRTTKAQKIRVRALPADKHAKTGKPTRLAGQSEQPANAENPDLFGDADAPQSMAVEEHNSVIEQAEIMLSYGRIEDAIGILLDYLENNPKKFVEPWLKLFDIYREVGMKTEFTGLAERFNKTLNVSAIPWERSDDDNAAQSLEDFPHIKGTITTLWGTVECLDYLRHLLLDNRAGARTGFPLPVVAELSTLIAMLQESLGIQPLPDIIEPVAIRDSARGVTPSDPQDSDDVRASAKIDPPAIDDLEPLEPFDLDSVSQAIAVEETDSVMAQAGIMLSYSRIEGAVRILLDYIENNPKKSVEPWLKLLSIYRDAAMKTEFTELAESLNKTLNVSVIPWEQNDDENAAPSIEHLAHIRDHIIATWGTLECLDYLQYLIQDNRNGARVGFPLPVVDEAICLIAILQDHLGLTETI